MTHFHFILRILFHHTRTTEGIRTLDGALLDAVVDAYAERQRKSIHETVDTYLSELEDPVEISSEAVVQFVSGPIDRKRLYLSINVPASETREIEVTLPSKEKGEQASSTPAPRAHLPGTHEDGRPLSGFQRFRITACDDGAIDYKSLYHLY